MFKKLKSLFIIEEEISAEELSPSEGRETADKPVTGNRVESISTRPIHGNVQDKFLKALFKAMDENNLDGFDYLEFKQFLQSLDKMEMDEATRFRSAFATARTVGATVEGIEKSADHYLEVLRNEKAKFEAAVERRRHDRIEKGQAQLVKIRAKIEDKRKAIAKLEGEIRELEQVLDEKGASLEKASEKIEQTNEDFIRTHSLLVEQIHADLKKIRTFLS